LWNNAAETWVENLAAAANARNTNFMSISGQIDFVMFGSAKSPKQVLKKLSDLTGYTPLPPLYSLGFHFSKWAPISTSLMLNRNFNFDLAGIPVDVFLMDINHNDKGKYFTFNPSFFADYDHKEMNVIVEQS
jgi:alpha 1,3-glucosidase